MGIILKGLEIDNFKSYTKKQTIHFSDLTVLLGANSSGKSTALQTLLAIKQTMESNSPDEELLLSGKYVALGDFDDVISDNSKNSFSITALLAQTELTENALEDDRNSVSWVFKRGDDGTSAILDTLTIKYEDIKLVFRRDMDSFHDSFHVLYIDGERSPYSARIYNLLMTEFYIHYDEKLNSKAAYLLNELLDILIVGKHAKVASNEPVSLHGITEFYFRLMDSIPRGSQKINTSDKELAKKLYCLISRFGNLLVPGYDENGYSLPKEFLIQVLSESISKSQAKESIENIVSDYDKYLDTYKTSSPAIKDYTHRSGLGPNPFSRFDQSEEKKDKLSQLEYALDFYRDFNKEIISKIFFVGPIRETPKGLYNIGFESIPKYVGPTGSYFASVLLHENKKIRPYILPNGIEQCTLSEALAEWMVHLNIASSVSVDKKNSFGFSVSIENMEQVKSDIMNVGIGTSQVLPVLISVLLSERNEILVFEQPELHLHPYSQSRLADLFVKYCKHGRRITIETHSEYFLLRLRYHIVKKYYSQKNSAVNFFHNDAGTKVEKATITGFGNIEYPVDFHDETQELLNSIIKASLERKGLS